MCVYPMRQQSKCVSPQGGCLLVRPVLRSVLVLPGLPACHEAQSLRILQRVLAGHGPPLVLCSQSLLASLSGHKGNRTGVGGGVYRHNTFHRVKQPKMSTASIGCVVIYELIKNLYIEWHSLILFLQIHLPPPVDQKTHEHNKHC